MAVVSTDKNEVKLGQEIHIQTDKVPEGWTGEILVGATHRFPVYTKLYTLSVTRENGFTTVSPTDLLIDLKDRKGRRIPVVGGGLIRVTVTTPLLRISPESSSVGPGRDSGQINVTALAGHEWSVTGIPDWMTITSGNKGSGDGVVNYSVAENAFNRQRSAAITVGDAVFALTQLRPPFILLPYTEDFNAPPPPVWAVSPPEIAAIVEPPTRWVLDDQPGQSSIVRVTTEAPGGANSLVVERQQADKQSWVTQIYLPRIKAETGAKYQVSVWLKAEKPTPVRLTFGQRTAPYHLCGLSQAVNVASAWSEFTLPFRVEGKACEADNNRFSIEAGAIAGKLWISKFSMQKN